MPHSIVSRGLSELDPRRTEDRSAMANGGGGRRFCLGVGRERSASADEN
jgi:hypothetical protein